MIPVLTYHRVCDFDISGTWVTPLQFEQQIKYLYNKKYTSISPCEFQSPIPNPQSLMPILITFDDGYEDFYTNALPILLKYGFKATVFIVTKYIGKENLWDVNFGKKKKHLSWKQLKELINYGFTIGSHTATHPDLRKIPFKHCKAELLNSKYELEDKLGSKIDCISYPFGKYTKEIVELTRDVGYRWAFTSDPFIKEINCIAEVHSRPMLVGRIGVYIIDDLNTFKNKLSKGAPYMIEGCKSRLINFFSYGTWLWKTWKNSFESFFKKEHLFGITVITFW